MKNPQTDLSFDAPSQFNFQNFGESTYNYSPAANDPLQYNSQQESNQQTPQETPQKSLFSLKYYQDLFDVNTDEVVNRIKWAIIPNPNLNYLQNYIRNKPDLYGPFWICITLIFSIGASGNLSEYLATAAGPENHWTYNFHAVTASGTLIFSYATMVPFLLWLVLQGYGNEQFKLQLLELICVYGYCLAVFVPLSVLWIIPIAWLQWTLVALGAITSAIVLVTSIYSAFTPKLYPLLAIALMLHLLLAACINIYFFHARHLTTNPGTPIDPPANTVVVSNSTQ